MGQFCMKEPKDKKQYTVECGGEHNGDNWRNNDLRAAVIKQKKAKKAVSAMDALLDGATN